MAVPKKRTSKASRNMRRSHHAKQLVRLATCARCHQLVPSHIACPQCGTYQGRDVIDVLRKLSKKERKAREQEQAAQDSSR
ncbi:MAG: 50S ribosomal protein L32 [Candidatus Andersenbacteria bacterium]